MTLQSAGPILPDTIRALAAGEPLDDLRATAAGLWLHQHGGSIDPDGSLADAVASYWESRPGDDPYWGFLYSRGHCSTCSVEYRYENLSICPHCLATFCYRHNATCSCGFAPVG